MSGRVEALWLKTEEYGPMEAVDALEVVRRTGIRGNANWGGRRQITVIEKERWEAMMEALGGPDLDPVIRRAYVMVSGCDLARSKHRVLRLGAVRVEIVGETRPCERMDAAHQGLRRVMAEPWNGGAYGIILDDGAIEVGDAVALDPPASS